MEVLFLQEVHMPLRHFCFPWIIVKWQQGNLRVWNVLAKSRMLLVIRSEGSCVFVRGDEEDGSDNLQWCRLSFQSYPGPSLESEDFNIPPITPPSLTTHWCTWMRSNLVITLCVTQWTIMACYHFIHKTWTYLKSPSPICWDRMEHCLLTPFLW